MASARKKALVTDQHAYRGYGYEIQLASWHLFHANPEQHCNFDLKMGVRTTGKFDDVVFRFQHVNGGQDFFHFLQAKHIGKGDESAIDTKSLLDKSSTNKSSKNKFYLPTYLKCFREMEEEYGKGNFKLFICTNASLDKENLKANGFKVNTVKSEEEEEEQPNKRRKLDQPGRILNFDGFVEKCGQRKSISYCLKTLSPLKDRIKQAFDRWKDDLRLNTRDEIETLFKDFLGSFVFVVNSPSAEEFDPLFVTNMGQYYSGEDANTQTFYFCKEVRIWYSNKGRQTSDRLNNENKIQWILSGVDRISSQYVKELADASVAFGDEAIKQMADNIQAKLSTFKATDQNPLWFLSSVTPVWTCVKVAAAVQLFFKAKNDQVCWVVANPKWTEEFDLWKRRIELRKSGSAKTILVIVEDKSSCSESSRVYLQKQVNSKFNVIVIGQSVESDWKDKIKFTELSEKTRQTLLSTNVSYKEFDGTRSTTTKVEDLMPSDDEQRNLILDVHSIRQLWEDKDKKIEVRNVATKDPTGYDPESYIERRLTWTFRSSISDLLARVARHSSSAEIDRIIHIDDQNGKIEWRTGNREVKSNYWQTISKEMEKMERELKSMENGGIDEEQLVQMNQNVVILSGVAGSGKSTVMSSLYHKLKNQQQTNGKGLCVMKITLTDKLFEAFYNDPDDPLDGIKFFLNLIGDGENPFLNSLMQYQLRTGEGMVLFLDGADEIHEDSQRFLLKLIRGLGKSVRVYVTTRSHAVNQLEFEMSQLAYKLIPFNRQDQIDYLHKRLSQDCDFKEMGDDFLKTFATKLVENAAKHLEREDERDECFIGIPLQCEVLAQCWQYEFHQLKAKCVDKGRQVLKEELFRLADEQRSTLARLFERFEEASFQNMQRKQGCLTYGQANVRFQDGRKELLKSFCRLGVRQIVQNSQQRDCLPSEMYAMNDSDVIVLKNYGIPSGYVNPNLSGEWQFRHRTFAEYFVAKSINNGLVNGLLDVQKKREWLADHLLIDREYRGILTFLDSMLNDSQLLNGGFVDLLNKKEETKAGYKAFTEYLSRLQMTFPQDNQPNVNRFLLSCLIHLGDAFQVRKSPTKFKHIERYCFQLAANTFELFTIILKGSNKYDMQILSNYFLSELNVWIPGRKLTEQLEISNAKKLLLFLFESTEHSLLLKCRLAIFHSQPHVFEAILNHYPWPIYEFVKLFYEIPTANNPWRLTYLQIAVFNNCIEYVKQVHEWILRRNYVDDVRPAMEYKKIIMSKKEEEFSPLYITFMRHNQHTSEVIAYFLKKLSNMNLIKIKELDEMAEWSTDIFQVGIRLRRQIFPQCFQTKFQYILQNHRKDHSTSIENLWSMTIEEITRDFRQLSVDISPVISNISPEHFDAVSTITHNPLQLTHLQLAVMTNNIRYVQQVHQYILKHPETDNVDRYKKLATNKQEIDLSDLLSIAALCHHQEIGLAIAKFLKDLSLTGHISQRELDDMCCRGGCLFETCVSDVSNYLYPITFNVHSKQVRRQILAETFAKEISNENLYLNSLDDRLGYEPRYNDDLNKLKREFISRKDLNDYEISLSFEKSVIVERVGPFWCSEQFMKEMDQKQMGEFVKFLIEVKTNDNSQRYCIWYYFICGSTKKWCKYHDLFVTMFLYRFKLKLGLDKLEAFVKAPLPFQSEYGRNVNLIEKVLSDCDFSLFIALISCFEESKQIKLNDKYLTKKIVDKIWDSEHVLAFRRERRYPFYRLIKLIVKRRPIVLADESCGHHSATNLYTFNRFIHKSAQEKCKKALSDDKMQWFVSDLFWQCLFANRVNGRPILGNTIDDKDRFMRELKKFVSYFPREKMIEAMDLTPSESLNKRIGNNVNNVAFEELKQKLFPNNE